MRKQDQDEGLGHPLQRDKLEQRYRGKTQFQEDCFQPEYKNSAGMGEEQLEGMAKADQDRICLANFRSYKCWEPLEALEGLDSYPSSTPRKG